MTDMPEVVAELAKVVDESAAEYIANPSNENWGTFIDGRKVLAAMASILGFTTYEESAVSQSAYSLRFAIRYERFAITYRLDDNPDATDKEVRKAYAAYYATFPRKPRNK